MSDINKIVEIEWEAMNKVVAFRMLIHNLKILHLSDTCNISSATLHYRYYKPKQKVTRNPYE